MKLVSFLKLVRFPNLAIAGLTQYLLQYLVLVPALKKEDLLTILDDLHFFLLVFTTILIAAGGYVINDLLDYESDLINKPEQVFVNRVFPKKSVWLIYWVVVLAGFAIAWYLAGYVKNIALVLIYPAAVFLLFFYSKKLKKLPFWGNVVVAVFCAFVAGVVLFAERENFFKMDEQGRVVKVLFGSYLVFAFLSTLLREIVKDIEDMEGDKEYGLRTLPIRFGEKTAKKWAIGIGGLLLFSLLVFGQWLLRVGKYGALVFMVLTVGLALLTTMRSIVNASAKADYSKASFLAKILMISGLVLLLFSKFA